MQRSNFRTAIVAALAASVLVLTACAGDADRESGDEDTFLVMVSGGKDAGPITKQLLLGVNSAKAAAEVVNAAGGIAGKMVEIIEVEDNGDPAHALTALNEQIAERKPNAYLVGTSANVSAAVAETLARNDILFPDTGGVPATNDPAGQPLAFHLVPPTSAVVESFAVEFEAQGYERIGILHGNSAYGQLVGQTAEALLGAAGFEIADIVEYDNATLDMTAQISRLREADPDVIMFNGFGPAVGYVLDGFKKLGWDVPLLGDTSVTTFPAVTTEAPDGLIGSEDVKNLRIQVTQSLVPSQSSDATKRAIGEIKKFGPIQATLTNAQNYDAIMILAAAGNAADSLDPEKIMKQLYDPEITGPSSGAAYVYERIYSPENHSPQVPADTHIFVAPAVVLDGQVAE